MGKIKICLKLLSLRLGHTAVESAEGKALLTKRFCSKDDECYPVQLLPAVRPHGRLHPAAGRVRSAALHLCTPS